MALVEENAPNWLYLLALQLNENGLLFYTLSNQQVPRSINQIFHDYCIPNDSIAGL
jgi:hypothetical protein